MSVAVKCDRCKNFYEAPKKDQVCVVTGYGTYFQDKIDLCPDCVSELKNWLKGENFNENL